MPLKLRELDGDRVKLWLRGEQRRPTQARIAFGALRAFVNWCSDQPDYHDVVHVNACAPRIAKQELPKKASRSDCLLREQLPAWFKAVRGLGNPVLAAYLQCLLITGARREEMATLPWENVDFRWGRLTIRDKVDGTRNIPLTPYVSHLIAALPRRGPWVFSSPAAKSGRVTEPRYAHDQAMVVAEIAGLTLHGLRRSFGTLAEWVECPAGVVAQIMGHKPSATAEKHYRVRPLDLLRVWHEKIEAWILAEAGVVFRPQSLGVRLASLSP
jgi:integrase